MIEAYIGARTHFSVGESILSPKALVKGAAAAGYKALAVADVHSINAMPMLFDACREHNMKAIIGAAFQVVDDLGWRKAGRGEPKRKPNPFFRAALYAKNEEGLREIMALLSLALQDDHFYFRPQIDLDDLTQVAGSRNLVLVLPAQYSVFSLSDAADKIEQISVALSDGQCYVELTPIDSAYYDKHNKEAMKLWAARPKFTPLLSRMTFNEPGQANLRNTMACVLDPKLKGVNDRWRHEPNDELHLQAPPELARSIIALRDRLRRHEDCASDPSPAISVAIRSSNAFSSLMTLNWEKWDVCLPTMSPQPFTDLVNLTKAGWAARLGRPIMGYQPKPEDLPAYRARLKEELSVLKAMGFENYFLLVRQIVAWSRENGIITGPGRGSVGGSLVAFLLSITDVDPIRFGLIFERFINPERLDLPDIDLDFMSSRRQEVIAHLVEAYGADRVAGISNYVELGSSSALRAVGSAHGLSEADFGCSKLVPKESGQPVSLEESLVQVPEIEKFALAQPAVWKEAVELQGVFRNYGRHAAGVIVAGEPIARRAVVSSSADSEPVINWDMKVCERFGLVKLDVLGLSNLDVMRLAADYIAERTGKVIDYLSVSLDDPKVLDAFGAARTIGVFQFDGGGMRGLLKSLAQNERLTFEDIAAATALFRPGPIQSGLMDNYVSIKQGNLIEEYLHDNMKPALKTTRSVIVYQEQVMQIARDLAGFTMAESDHLRKAMGKKDAEKMAKMRQQWVDGCERHSGLAPAISSALFDQIEKFAGYAFNKSHAVAYTVISYWTMWTKVYYPAEFFAAALTVLKEDKHLKLVKDAATFNIEIWPPDVNVSSNRFEIVDHVDPSGDVVQALVCPFQAVKGVSEKGAAALLEGRAKAGGAFDDRKHFIASINRRVCNIRVQEALDKVGALANLPGETGLPARHPDRLKDQKQLLPGLITDSIKADRKMDISPFIKGELIKVVDAVQECGGCTLAGTPHVAPRLGRSPKVMIVCDYPNWSECDGSRMGEGQASKPLLAAIKQAGLGLADCYITSLIRAGKPRGGEIANEMIIGCSKYLDREIEVLKPPVIVALGSKASRHLVPDIKGGWEEILGQEHYDAKRDATVVIGFNYQMIAFDPGKQDLLNEVFDKVAEFFA